MSVGAASASRTLTGPAPLKAAPLLAFSLTLGAARRRGRRDRRRRRAALTLGMVALPLALLALRLATTG
eukprot:4580503-Alexandrium_andersonii.AAC.1